MGNPNSSAGVYSREKDNSQRVEGIATSIAVVVGDSRRGPVGQRTLVTSDTQFLAQFGYPDASLSFMHHCALAFLAEGTRLYVTRVSPEARFGGCIVSFSDGLCSVAPFAPEGQEQPEYYEFRANELFSIYAADPGAWNNDLTVHIYPNTRDGDGSFYIDVYQVGNAQPVERHMVHLDMRLDGFGIQRNVEHYINSKSSLIRVTQNLEQTEFRANPRRDLVNTLRVQRFAGGVNGRKATTGEIMQGWDLYMDKEEVECNMLINAGYVHPAIQSKMTGIAEYRMDSVAILDTPSDMQRVQDAITYRRNTLMLDSSYAALYSPDYLVYDKYSDRQLYIPPSGHVAACYAKTDRDYATWFAPAGMERGKLAVRGVRHEYNQGDRDMLTDNQVNATRVILGAGINIWGADTLQVKASALSNVSVRRLMIFIEESLTDAVIHSVFDPNDPILRSQLVEITERFLRPIFQARGLYWFKVICDENNNPPEVVANGDLNLDVYLDPVLPAKRIHLTAIVTKTGARFTASGL